MLQHINTFLLKYKLYNHNPHSFLYISNYKHYGKSFSTGLLAFSQTQYEYLLGCITFKIIMMGKIPLYLQRQQNKITG